MGKKKSGKPEGATELTAQEKEARLKEKKRLKEEKKAKAAAKLAKKAQQAPAENKDGKKKKGADRFSDENKPKFVNKTPVGHRKDMAVPISDSYQPDQVEASWDAWWEAQGLYKADNESKEDPYVVMIPPPNVTGTLHLGHALTCSIEDCVIRWNRMKGKNCLWLPGTDHAGIATQVVVEKKLMRENGKTRHELGRENFLKEVWKWVGVNGGRICNQLRRLGASVDWSRQVFTMDESLSKAVTEAFLRMYKKGLIYRSNRLVWWSCTLKTAISAIEVEYKELTGPTKLNVPGYDKKIEFGVIHSFAYKVDDGSGDEIIVATTRLETMLGDVCVCVHPEDPRYTKYIGKTLKHPFIAGRVVTVIPDAILVDMNFGSGAVKVTPAHDPNDYKTGKRHDLQFISLFDDAGNMNANCGQFTGMKRFDCRYAIIDELTKMGLYRGKATNPMSLGFCSRSKDVVEQVIRPQWWVSCEGMAKRAVDAVRNKDLLIMPEFHEATWFRWLENIQDWCISRQLWWGHRIPAYYIQVGDNPRTAEIDCDQNLWVVAKTEAEALAEAKKRFPKAKKISLVQDPDVLDTWFSSGLFPFSTMGWPDKTPDMKAFYPGTLLETGHDILFFWVARMVMQGLELTDQLPFNKVYLHAMVRDKLGRKMSKSLGNVLDPIDVMEGISLAKLQAKLQNGNLDPKELKKASAGQQEDFPNGIAQCGTDALRFGLLAYTVQGRDINLDIQRVVAYRQFCNKLWNATKFAMLYFDSCNFNPPSSHAELYAAIKACPRFADKWILSRLAAAVAGVNKAFEEFVFGDGCTAAYNFWLHDLCDVYLEVLKPICQKDSGSAGSKAEQTAALSTLFLCLDYGLRLLHPMMPFVTEELFHRLPGHAQRMAAAKQAKDPRLATGSIMVQPFPETEASSKWINQAAEADMHTIHEIAHTSRSTRASLALNKKVNMFVLCSNAADAKMLNHNAVELAVTAKATTVTAVTAKTAEMEACVPAVVNGKFTIFIPVAGNIDLVGELGKLDRKRRQLQKSLTALIDKTGGERYKANVSADVKAKDAEKKKQSQAELDALKESKALFLSLLSAPQRDEYAVNQQADLRKDIAKVEKDMKKQMGKKAYEDLNKKTKDKVDAWRREIEQLEQAIEQVAAASSGSAPAQAPAAQAKGAAKKEEKLAEHLAAFLADPVALNKHLASSSFVGGTAVSVADVQLWRKRPAVVDATLAHVARWHKHISALPAHVRDSL